MIDHVFVYCYVKLGELLFLVVEALDNCYEEFVWFLIKTIRNYGSVVLFHLSIYGLTLWILTLNYWFVSMDGEINKRDVLVLRKEMRA